MAKISYLGSICLTDIPKHVIRTYAATGKMYLSFAIIERKEVGTNGETHFISCQPRKEERQEGVNYIIGDIKPFVEPRVRPSVDDINKAEAGFVDKAPWED